MEESHDAGWWLRGAERDEAVAERLMKVGFHEGVGEHLAQAAQKYLRALLAQHGLRSRAKSCAELVEELAEAVSVPDELSGAATALDDPPRKKRIKSLDDIPERLKDEGAIDTLAQHLEVVKSFALEALGHGQP